MMNFFCSPDPASLTGEIITFENTKPQSFPLIRIEIPYIIIAEDLQRCKCYNLISADVNGELNPLAVIMIFTRTMIVESEVLNMVAHVTLKRVW
jgi:hypothetical protein